MIKPTLPPNAKRVFKGQIFDVYQWEQKMFDGSKATFELLKRPDTVQIIPVLESGKIVILAEQQPNTPVFFNFVGGRVEQGEEPPNAAKRELLEETGFTAEALVPWLAYAPYSKAMWTIHYFIAKKAKKVQSPQLDAGERIKTKEISLDDFLKLPNNREGYAFRGGGLINEELIRAQYDEKKRQELENLFFQ